MITQIKLKDVNTHERKTVNVLDKVLRNGKSLFDCFLSGDFSLFATQYGLFISIPNSENGTFEDIEKVTKIVFGSGSIKGEYLVESYADGETTYKYRRSRNLYNKHDEPEVVIVG